MEFSKKLQIIDHPPGKERITFPESNSARNWKSIRWLDLFLNENRIPYANSWDQRVTGWNVVWTYLILKITKLPLLAGWTAKTIQTKLATNNLVTSGREVSRLPNTQSLFLAPSTFYCLAQSTGFELRGRFSPIHAMFLFLWHSSATCNVSGRHGHEISSGSTHSVNHSTVYHSVCNPCLLLLLPTRPSLLVGLASPDVQGKVCQ